MMRSDASLKGKIKALAKKSNLKPQELLQMYLFEHLLVRLGKSGYAEAFVLKGGLLISSMTGVAQRITMDMDTTVIGMDMDEDTVSEAVAATFIRSSTSIRVKSCSTCSASKPSRKQTSSPRLRHKKNAPLDFSSGAFPHIA